MVHGKEIAFIASHYGYDAQTRQLIEEMAELTQAINKFWRYQLDYGKKELEDVDFGTTEEKDIIEEIGDVEICLDQIKWLLKCSTEVEVSKSEKIQREIARIKGKNNT